MSKNKYNDFEKYSLNDTIKENYLPGLGAVIFDNKNIKYTFVKGYVDLKTKRKLDINDKFCIGSCSKSILCTTIASLIDKKKIPNIWDMTLESIWSKSIHSEFKKVTVNQLISHNSGIMDVPFDKLTKRKVNITKKLEGLDGMKSRQKLANILLKQKPDYEPGSKFVYSNCAYGILGAILEKITKKDYTKSIDEEIMKPLNINAEYGYFYGKKYVNGHYYVGWDKNLQDKITPLNKNQFINTLYDSPAGVIWMSLLDCVKYCQLFMLNNTQNKITQTVQTIKTSTIKYLTKPIFQHSVINYAYGWGRYQDKYLGHIGSDFFIETKFHLIPEKNVGIILFTNLDGFNFKNIIEEFLKTI